MIFVSYLVRVMSNEINMFYAPIKHKKKRHDFRAWLELRKLRKFIKKTSPSYNIMLNIYDFLIILKNVYMYNVDMKLNLVAGSLPSNSHEGSIVYEEDSYRIIYLLNKKQSYDGQLPIKEIQIEMARKGIGSKSNDKIYFTFIDGTPYTFKSDLEEDQILFITANLMNSLDRLILYYYKNKQL